MEPAPGTHSVRYVGDRLQVRLAHPNVGNPGWKAFLRTNLTRAACAREEMIALAGVVSREPRTFAGASWRDIPLREKDGAWLLDLPLTEVGHFRAKAYCVDPDGHQHWPEGSDFGLSVNPDKLRSANLIYCAFPRLFGVDASRGPTVEVASELLEREAWTAIPPSGKLRDLTAQVPHIFDHLGCRILHLLPLAPTPTTYARFGQFGSPYAGLDLTAIDPALVVFDGHTTAEDQFQELADAVHARGGMVFLDLVVHHTGWGSRLMEQHPGWFRREASGRFQNPGAWDVVWADLVELEDSHPHLWDLLAEALLVWCRRGVDGFRCDAGYMVPMGAWQYIQARVRQLFPDSVFLLEGLGGAWEITENLLSEGGMQWAYSELFQNYDGQQVSAYLDHALRQSARVGPLVHYSETHDNPRLAMKGATWSLMRNRLCALTSGCGAFGYTCGVEWLAEERIDVHGRCDLAWGRVPNLVAELAELANLLAEHPCFFDGAIIRRLSPEGSPVLALERISQEGADRCLVVVNLDPDQPGSLVLPHQDGIQLCECTVDLLGQSMPARHSLKDGCQVDLGPGAAYCLAGSRKPNGLAGEAYRNARSQAAWALQQLAAAFPSHSMGPCDWRALGALAAQDPLAFLGAMGRVKAADLEMDPVGTLERAMDSGYFPTVQLWEACDLSRVMPVPPGHWLLFRNPEPFRLRVQCGGIEWHTQSIPVPGGHIAAYPPRPGLREEDAHVEFLRLLEPFRREQGKLRFLGAESPKPSLAREGLVLLTNGRGAMARIPANLGQVASKYDCLLGANLDPQNPCDRHVLVKRVRVWVNVDGFLTTLDAVSLESVIPGPPATWTFLVNAGDGRRLHLWLEADMVQGRNAVLLRFGRPKTGEILLDAHVSINVRLDLEDRSFHQETEASETLDRHWNANTKAMEDRPGFMFEPAPDRHLRAWASGGAYHPGPEWSCGVAHPLEGERGQRDHGDAWSPGWFELPLESGKAKTLTLCAELEDPPTPARVHSSQESFEGQLRRATRAFLASRGEGRTIIAGFPWFLDWGRDAAVAVRGLVAGGMISEARAVLLTLGGEELRGSLPNRLGPGGDRVTSDAPLWFALACEETAEAFGQGFYETLFPDGRTLRDVLLSLGRHHISGTEAGVRMDPESGLVFSPARHTWMDTGYPDCTPREGYPIEIQILWIRLLRQLAHLDEPGEAGNWETLAGRAQGNLERFWMEDAGWFADVLEAPEGVPAANAIRDPRLRPNQLLAITLGCVGGARARRMVDAATRHLLVPGAMRSLAPLPADPPRPLRAADGMLLNDPRHPYWGHYQGDEDTRRKPAYHNGTAWVWWLPIYCEALAQAWNFDPLAVQAARAQLSGLGRLLGEGCLGHLPEILDGDAPHRARGCDAQAWSAAEALRVWVRLEQPPS
ncbi:MAG: glycogen debranching enzyme N-terminal domain-containing protein [Holophagaceae bacterium]|nr:glycogen debranching enzyme N-terminal domain-containing protein [Holophagaceae bacterium]